MRLPLLLVAVLVLPVTLPAASGDDRVAGIYVFEGRAGDAATFEFSAGANVYGVLFDPDGDAFDLRSSWGSHVPFILTRDGVWMFELKRYDGLTWSLAPGASSWPGAYSVDIRPAEHVSTEHATARWHVLEARWDEATTANGFLAVDLPHGAAPESLVVLLEADRGGKQLVDALQTSSAGVGTEAALGPVRIEGVEELDAASTPLGTRHLFRFYNVDVRGALRMTVVSTQPVSVDMSVATGAPLEAAAARGDEVVTWSDADATGLATPAASVGLARERPLHVVGRFAGLFTTHEASGEVVSPSGAVTRMGPGSSRLFRDAEQGTWTLRLSDTQGVGQRHYLQGAFVPALGIY